LSRQSSRNQMKESDSGFLSFGGQPVYNFGGAVDERSTKWVSTLIFTLS